MSFFRRKNKEQVEDVEEDNEELNQNLWDTSEVLHLIMDARVPSIKDHNGNIIFERDYENRRVILSKYILGMLLKNGQLKTCINHFKDNNLIDYISLYEHRMDKNIMVNMYIKGNDTYLVPFKYIDDERNENSLNDEIYYSASAQKVDEKLGVDTGYNDNIDINEIKFCSIKDPDNGNKYLPLFKSKDELRKIFNEECSICKITYSEAAVFCTKYLGMVFRPTEESFIISNNIAGFFTAVTPYAKPIRDYRKFTKGQVTIQDKIKRLHSIKVTSDKFNDYFKGILQNINDLNKFYVALSKTAFSDNTGMSVPLITNKDGKTSIYIFSDIDIAKKWTERFGNFTKGGIPLIGEVKSNDNFDSIFTIAEKLGVNLCTVDEEGSFFIFNIKLFMDVNNLDRRAKLRVPKEIADKHIIPGIKNDIKVNFNYIKAISLQNLPDNEEYTEVIIK